MKAELTGQNEVAVRGDGENAVYHESQDSGLSLWVECAFRLNQNVPNQCIVEHLIFLLFNDALMNIIV